MSAEFPNPDGRPASAGGKKRTVVGVRLNDAEVAHLDHQRGALTRSQYLRLLLKQARATSK